MSKAQTVDLFDDDGAQDSGMDLQIDLQHYLRILRKNKWPITLFTALVTLLAGYYAYTATPIYSSSSTLLIENQKANVVRIEELYGVDAETGDYYQTQYEILRSRALAKRVVAKLGLFDESMVRAAVEQQMALESTGQGGSETGAVGTQQEAADTSSQGIVEQIKSMFTGLIGGDTSDTAPQARTIVAEGTDTTAMDEAARAALIDRQVQQRLDAAVRDFQRRLTIDPLRQTKLVKIRYASPDPDFAALAANTVAEEYILSVLDARMELREKATTWLNDRLSVLKSKLDDSEQRLIRFKQDNGLVDVNGSVGRLNEQELLLATTELAQARSEFSDASDVYREAQELRRTAPELLETMPVIQADPLVRSVKTELGQRQRELDELSNRYGEKHPRIVDARSRITSLQNTLNGHIERVVASLQKDFQLRRQRVNALEATLAAGKEEIQVIGEKKFELDALEREVATNRDLYNQFFSRITETDSADGLDAANARISDYAIASTIPIKPRKQLIIALAALGSLVLSMLMAILYEQMDENIKSVHDVEHKLGIKMLGILPLIKSGWLGTRRELPLNPLEISDTKGTFVESVNTVRTALVMEDRQNVNKVVLVTSSIPGEGKSSTALNLAHAFSQLEKVLLIDCDMRRPSLAMAIGLEKNAPGLSSLITKQAMARDCIHRNAIGSVDVLASGPMPDQPLELLSSNRFANIIAQLRQHYDRIIIDSAPTQAVSDSLVLSRLSDSVVYVVKSHETSYQLVKRGLARLAQVNAPVSGAVITQVDMDKLTSYGGDYYYQGYYDYYGYNKKGGEKRTSGKISLTPQELHQIKVDQTPVDLGLSPDNRMATNGHRHESPVDEFDLTTQLQSPATGHQEYPGQRRRAGLQQEGRFKDDLDII